MSLWLLAIRSPSHPLLRAHPRSPRPVSAQNMDDSLRLLAEAEAGLAEFGSPSSAPPPQSSAPAQSTPAASDDAGLQRRRSAVISRKSKKGPSGSSGGGGGDSGSGAEATSDVIPKGLANSRSEAMLLYNAVAKAESGVSAVMGKERDTGSR